EQRLVWLAVPLLVERAPVVAFGVDVVVLRARPVGELEVDVEGVPVSAAGARLEGERGQEARIPGRAVELVGGVVDGLGQLRRHRAPHRRAALRAAEREAAAALDEKTAVDQAAAADIGVEREVAAEAGAIELTEDATDLGGREVGAEHRNEARVARELG